MVYTGRQRSDYFACPSAGIIAWPYLNACPINFQMDSNHFLFAHYQVDRVKRIDTQWLKERILLL